MYRINPLWNYRPKLYLASPLFSESDREFNNILSEKMRHYFDVFLPQRDVGLLKDFREDGLSHFEATNLVFCKDVNAVRNTDILLAVLNGENIDEGAAFEIGLAFAENTLCFGLWTDVLNKTSPFLNPMIERSLEKIFYEIEDFINWTNHFFRFDYSIPR